MRDFKHPLARLLILGVVLDAGAAPQGPPTLTPRDAALIAEAFHQWNALGPAVWPGLEAVRAPILYITDEHEYFVDFPGPADSILLDQRISGRMVYARQRQHSRTLSASFDIQGVSVAALGTPEALGKPPERWVLTALHEMFHVFQHKHGGPEKIAPLELPPSEERNASWHLNFPFPYANQDVMNLIHLQAYPLFLAANDASIDNRRYNVRVSLEAGAVYQSVLQSLAGRGDRNYRYSLFQQWSEGVAFYVEYRFAKVAASSAKPTEAFVNRFGSVDYGQVWIENYEQRRFLAKHAGRAARSRTAFCHLGFAKALALDSLFPSWKDKYFTPDVWLDQLLEQGLASGKGTQ